MALLVTANLGRGVTTEEFLRNLAAVRAKAGPGAIVGFQEIDEDDGPDEHAGLRKVFGASFGFVGFGTRVPIAYGPRWTVRRDRVIRAARGLFRLSPDRVINEVVYVHVSGHELAVLNVHFPRSDVRLLSRWRSVEAKLQRRLRHHHKRCRTAVWLGDANRAWLPKMHPRERTLARGRLDWIRVVPHPSGVRLRRTAKGSIPLTIDGHNAVWTRVRVRAPKSKHQSKEHR